LENPQEENNVAREPKFAEVENVKFPNPNANGMDPRLLKDNS